MRIEASVEGQVCVYALNGCEACKAEKNGETEQSEQENESESEKETESESEAQPDESVEAVRNLILALPSLEELEAMSWEEKLAAYNATQEADTAYWALTEEQRALLTEENAKLDELFGYFNTMTAPTADDATSGYTGDLYWQLQGSTLMIDRKEGAEQYVAMPDYGVSSPENRRPWNDLQDEITEIIIGEGITHIGDFAFASFDQLTDVSLPDTVKSIGKNAFRGCSLPKSIVLPSSVTTIGESAFMSCEFTSITIPSSVKTIGNTAFSESKLTSITIPSGVTTIGSGAFRFCEELVTANIETTAGISSYCFHSCSKLQTVTYAGVISGLQEVAFGGCENISSFTMKAATGTSGSDALGSSNTIFYLLDGSGNNVTDWYKISFSDGNGNNKKVTVKKNIEKATIDSIADLTYNGTAQTPAVTVKFGDETLTSGTDYTVSGTASAMDPGTYSVTVTGTGNFSGTKTVEWKIVKGTIEIPTIESKDYNGTTQTADIEENNIYSVEENNGGIDAGTYPVRLKLKDTVNYKWANTDSDTDTAYFSITQATNSWRIEPGITGWTYGETQNAPIGEALFGTVIVGYEGKDEWSSSYREYDASELPAGNYTAKFQVKETANYTGLTKDVPFTISKADPDYTAPSIISNLVYDGSSQALIAEGTTNGGDMVYKAVKADAEGGFQVPSMTDLKETIPQATEAGTYRVYYGIQSNENYNELFNPNTMYVDVTIAKASYDMSTAQWDYTNAFDYDGLEKEVQVIGPPNGVKVESYTGNKATAEGTYEAEAVLAYDAENYETPVMPKLTWVIKNDWAPAEDTEYSISEPNSNGWWKEDLKITAGEDYLLSFGNTLGGQWSDTLSVGTEDKNGTITFYVKNKTTGLISQAVTEEYRLDKTVPTGKVEFADRASWQEFVNEITFDLFYKEEVKVIAAGTDEGSGVETIEYASADTALTLEEVKALTDWKELPEDGVSVALEDAAKFVYFVRITDKAGNVAYLSTDGAVYDTQPPVISGITDGEISYTTQVFTAGDTNLETVEVKDKDGQEVTVEGTADTGFVLNGNEEQVYTVTVTDKAGNSTVATITMKPISAISDSIKDITEETVTGEDADVIRAVEETIAGLDTETATEEEKAALASIQEKIDALQKVIEDTAAEVKALEDAVAGYDKESIKLTDEADVTKLITDLTEKLKDANLTPEQKSDLTKALEEAQELAEKITADQIALEEALTDQKDTTEENYTVADKADLEAAADALENIIKEENQNYIEGEKKEAQEELDRINKLIESIERVEDAVQKAEDAVNAAASVDAAELPDHAAAVEKLADAKQAYEALSEKEKTLLNADQTAQVQKVETLYEDAVSFWIIEGMDGVFTKGTSKGLEFTANGTFDLFAEVRVDGEMVDASNYTVNAGSKIVTLKADYLKTLSNGEHSFEVIYDVLGKEYSAGCMFKVKKAAAAETEAETSAVETEAQTGAKAADTGDTTNITIWLSMMLASALGALLLLGSKKKKYYN